MVLQRRTVSLAVLLLMMVLLPVAVFAADGMKITEMAVTTKIVRGNPIDCVHRISATSVKALYCFTRIVNPAGEETTLKHVWYKDGQQVGEYELPVKGEKWRTYSKKVIDAESRGAWKVEALDAAGNLLKTVDFRIN